MFMCDGSSTETEYSRMHAIHSIAAHITYLGNIVLFSELESNSEAPKEDGDERACMSEWRHLQYCTFPLVQLALQLLERLRYGRQRPVVTVLHRHRAKKYPPRYPIRQVTLTPNDLELLRNSFSKEKYGVTLNPFFINHANAQFHKLRIQFFKCKEIEMASFGCNNFSSQET